MNICASFSLHVVKVSWFLLQGWWTSNVGFTLSYMWMELDTFKMEVWILWYLSFNADTTQIIRQTLRLSIQQQVQNTLIDKLFSGQQLLFYSSIWINPASHIAVWTDSSSEFFSQCTLTLLSLSQRKISQRQVGKKTTS